MSDEVASESANNRENVLSSLLDLKTAFLSGPSAAAWADNLLKSSREREQLSIT